MYVWMRTYSAKIGKMAEAVALTTEAAAHAKKQHSLEIEIYTQVGGDPMKIGIAGRYDSLADLGKMEEAIAADEQWAAIVNRAAPLLEEGTVEDNFWKKL
jgi:hypothetical protein